MHEIETARLRLRQFTLDDIDVYYETTLQDPDVMRWLPGGQVRPKEDAERHVRYYMEYWHDHGFGLWAVHHRADDCFAGHAGLMLVPNTSIVEVAYAIAKPYWGQGLATEAGHASLRYGFEQHDFARIVALFFPGNVASERVMIKLGMTGQGTMHAYDDDLPCYAITRGDFTPGSAPYQLLDV